jgi:trimeric autotransporter adhesin
MRSGKITFPKGPLMSSRVSAHLRNNLVGYIALFCFAMGGTAYATHPGGEKTISSIDIIDDEVFSDDVANDTLAGGGLAAADLRPDSVGTSEVALNSLNSLDLSPNSVGFSEIADNSIRTEDVATNTLTSIDLASSSVGTSEVATNSLTGSDIAEASLTGLDPEAVSPRKYANVTGLVGATGVSLSEVSSKGIAEADVKRVATGTYCFELGYVPDSVIGTVQPAASSHMDRIVTGNRGTGFGCAAGTDAAVYLRDASIGGAVDGAFFVQFESK